MTMETKEIVKTQKTIPTLFSSDPAAIAAAETARARIQAAYMMALHKPRNEDEARARIIHSCKRPGFAEKVEFNKPVAGRQIQGPSIRFAEVALRAWENIFTETQVIYEDDYVRRIKVFVTDLETNRIASKEIQLNKTIERKKTKGREVLGERINTNGEKVFIVKATEDEIANKEAALISKAIRNEGLRLIPTDITDEAIETARKTLCSKDAEDPDTAKKKLLDAFSAIGVRPKDLEQYLGRKTEVLNPSELQELRGIYRAIKDGEASWADYISENPEPPKVSKTTYQTKEAASAATEVAPAPEVSTESHLLITSFSKLNKAPLQKFEETHRDEIQTWPANARNAFHKKWEAKMKQPYEVFLRRLKLINGEEPDSKGLSIVKCPVDGESKTLEACKNVCPNPEIFENKECLARWPE